MHKIFVSPPASWHVGVGIAWLGMLKTPLLSTVFYL